MTDELVPYEGMWDFDGSCAPREDGIGGPMWSNQITFTLGIFQWQKMARGKGLKRGKVQKRIRGNVSDPKLAYDLAREFCKAKNDEDAK